jgi:hypothetical protein
MAELAPLLAIVFLPGVVGTVIWILGGASLRDALSWTLPLTAVFAVGFLLIPSPLSIPVLIVAFIAFATMLFSETVATWWFVHVLHRGPSPAEQAFDRVFEQVIATVDSATRSWRTEEQVPDVLRVLDAKRSELLSLEAPTAGRRAIKSKLLDHIDYTMAIVRGDQPATGASGDLVGSQMDALYASWNELRSGVIRRD